MEGANDAVQDLVVALVHVVHQGIELGGISDRRGAAERKEALIGLLQVLRLAAEVFPHLRLFRLSVTSADREGERTCLKKMSSQSVLSDWMSFGDTISDTFRKYAAVSSSAAGVAIVGARATD